MNNKDDIPRSGISADLSHLSAINLILSVILLIYSIFLIFYTTDTAVRILSLLFIIYYIGIIPVQYNLLGKECYCK